VHQDLRSTLGAEVAEALDDVLLDRGVEILLAVRRGIEVVEKPAQFHRSQLNEPVTVLAAVA